MCKYSHPSNFRKDENLIKSSLLHNVEYDTNGCMWVKSGTVMNFGIVIQFLQQTAGT